MLTPRPFGSTGLLVSPLGLGTVKLGRDRGVAYPQSFRIPTDDEALDLLARAQDLGLTLLDTAPAYGTSEERLGRLLVGQRDRWTIVTKAGEEFDMANAASSFDFSPQAITASVERSLRRLRTDRVECVLLHSSGDDVRILRESGAVEALERLKAQGKIRAFGASTKTPEGGLLAVERCDAAMLTLNPAFPGDLPAVRRAAELGRAVLIKKGLFGGHLSRAPVGASSDPIEASMRFALGEPGVSCLVVGTINAAHLEQNVRAAERALA